MTFFLFVLNFSENNWKKWRTNNKTPVVERSTLNCSIQNFLPRHDVNIFPSCVFRFSAFLRLSTGSVHCAPDENDRPSKQTQLCFTFVNLCCVIRTFWLQTKELSTRSFSCSSSFAGSFTRFLVRSFSPASVRWTVWSLTRSFGYPFARSDIHSPRLQFVCSFAFLVCSVVPPFAEFSLLFMGLNML